METQSRFKSWVFWSSLAAQVVSLLVLFEVIPGERSETVNAAIAAILQAFVAFGILNNPTNRAGF